MLRRNVLQCLLQDRSSHLQNLCIVQVIEMHQDDRVTIRLVILTL